MPQPAPVGFWIWQGRVLSDELREWVRGKASVAPPVWAVELSYHLREYFVLRFSENRVVKFIEELDPRDGELFKFLTC